jgi:pseudouridine-5'-phosphate glycosidase
VALQREKVEALIAEALMAAEVKGLRGKAVTPFLLSHLSELSGGQTLQVNMALLQNNAGLAARVASELTKIGFVWQK